MKNQLTISKDLSLPPVAVTEKLAWLGTTGSGKTYGASKLAEEFFFIGAQFIVLDPVGVWYGLRLAKDGKRPSKIAIPIFGGLHGDVPLESTGGEFMANLVVDKGLSCVLDVSQFESDAEKARFAAAFANRFFFRKKAAPSAVHLFLEECQEFVPQNPQRGEEQMLHAFIRMQKLGRNFGIGSSYITQRPQEVSKKALNMAQTLFVFRTTGTHERTAIEKWIEDKSLDQSIAQDLPKIPTGSCHVWSPEFLKISSVVRIAEKETFNASATPEVGAAAKARELAPIDLKKIRDEMAATIEKAKSEDPKALRRQVAELQRQLAAKPEPKVVKSGPVKVERIEVPIVGKKTLKGLQLAETRIKKMLQDMRRIAATTTETFRDGIGEVERQVERFSRDLAKASAQKPAPAATFVPPPKKEGVAPLSTQKEPIVNSGDFKPSGPQQKILDSLAWLHNADLVPANKVQLAFLSDQSSISSSYSNNLGTLRTAGLISYPGPGTVELTTEGWKYARGPERARTVAEFHQQIREKVSGPQWNILQVLLQAYPNPVAKSELADRAGTTASSSSYSNNLGTLRSLGLIEYPAPGMVVALPVLFLEK